MSGQGESRDEPRGLDARRLYLVLTLPSFPGERATPDTPMLQELLHISKPKTHRSARGNGWITGTFWADGGQEARRNGGKTERRGFIYVFLRTEDGNGLLTSLNALKLDVYIPKWILSRLSTTEERVLTARRAEDGARSTFRN